MTMDKNVKKAGALLTITVIIIVGTLGAISLGVFDKPVEKPKPIEPKPYYPIDHLSIDASFLLKTDETNESVNVSCDLFMTNTWEKESGEIKATAYVIETSTNLAIYKNTVVFGNLDANSTTELNIPLQFSDSNYEIEILLFEDNKIVLKAKSTITSRQRYYYSGVGSKVYLNDFLSDPVSSNAFDGQWEVKNTDLSFYRVH